MTSHFSRFVVFCESACHTQHSSTNPPNLSHRWGTALAEEIPTYVQSQPNAIPLGLKFYNSLGNNGITEIFGRTMCRTSQRPILPNIFAMPLFPHVLSDSSPSEVELRWDLTYLWSSYPYSCKAILVTTSIDGKNMFTGMLVRYALHLLWITAP